MAAQVPNLETIPEVWEHDTNWPADLDNLDDLVDFDYEYGKNWAGI